MNGLAQPVDGAQTTWATAPASTGWTQLYTTKRADGYLEVGSQDLFVEWRVESGHGPVARSAYGRTGPAGSTAIFPVVGNATSVYYRVMATVGAGTCSPQTGVTGATGTIATVQVSHLTRFPAPTEVLVRMGGTSAGDVDALAVSATPTVIGFPPGSARRAILQASGTCAIVGEWLDSSSNWYPAGTALYDADTGLLDLPWDPWLRLSIRNDGPATLSAGLLWRPDGGRGTTPLRDDLARMLAIHDNRIMP